MAYCKKEYGRRKGGATGHSKEKHDASPRSYIQKWYDSPIKVPGSDILVSWCVHNGNTQIHIASADFQTTKFDVVILPLKKDMIGINTYPKQSGTRSYGFLFSRSNDRPWKTGQYMTRNSSKELACKKIEVGLFSETNTKENQQTIDKIVKKLINKQKNKEIVRTIAIPVQFDGLYDPIDFLTSIIKNTDRDNMEQIACFLCFNGEEPELVPFMKRVNEFLGTRQSPRRLVISQHFRDSLFPTISVSIEIKIRGILNAGCECIVAAIGGNYKLDKSTLTKSIAEFAGADLQRNIEKLDKEAYQIGDVIHCDSFRLGTKGVKSILFGRLTKWEKRHEGDKHGFVKEVSNFVKECLLTADDNGCKSVAFPVLGSGYLNYPEDIIVTSLLRGIDKYTSSATKGNVSRVVIAYFDGEDKDSLYQKFESGIISRRSCMEYGAKQAANKDSPGSDSMDTQTNDDPELLYDEVTAEVNPGITAYLADNDQIEKFKNHFSNQFNVNVHYTDGKLFLKGTWTGISKAEDFLDKAIATGPMFDHADKDASSLDEPKLANSSERCDSPVQNTNKEDLEAVTVVHEDTHVVANIKSEMSRVPRTVIAKTFIIPESDRKLAVFKTNDMFSFQTEIKVVTTDKTFTDKNQYLAQVLERNPECLEKWNSQSGKTHEQKYLDVCILNQPDTCNCIVLAVVPYVTDVILNNEKKQFKQDIITIARKILDTALEMDAQSITLPILVHTGVGAAVEMCLASMAQNIIDYLRRDSCLEHINVIFDSDTWLKSFSSLVAQKLNQKGNK